MIRKYCMNCGHWLSEAEQIQHEVERKHHVLLGVDEEIKEGEATCLKDSSAT